MQACHLRLINDTGYNGTPDNIKACGEGRCKRCWDISIEHGERLDECFCIHGEESALLEADRHQVNIELIKLKMESIPLLRLIR